jgi:hypothetical protein
MRAMLENLAYDARMLIDAQRQKKKISFYMMCPRGDCSGTCAALQPAMNFLSYRQYSLLVRDDVDMVERICQLGCPTRPAQAASCR